MLRKPKFHYKDKVIFQNDLGEFKGWIKGILQFGKTISYAIVTNDGKEFPLIRESSILKRILNF